MTFRFLLPLLLLVSGAGFAQSAFRLRGVILDRQTKAPVSFASIGVAATPLGTHSNQHGEFTILFPPAAPPGRQRLRISCLGYQSLEYGLDSLPANAPVVILLTPHTISLGEIVVSSGPLTAEQLVRKTREKIADNYSADPYLLRLFYRNICREAAGSRLVEAKADLYDPKGHGRLHANPNRKVHLRVNRLRRSYDFTRLFDQHDYLNFNGILRQDVTSYPSMVLKPSPQFTYRIQDTLYHPEQPVYLVTYAHSFQKQNKHPFKRQLQGTLYIGAHDFALLKFEEQTRDEVYLPADTVRRWEQQVFTYHKTGGKYFLEQALRDFSSFKLAYDSTRRREIPQHHETHLELVVEQVLQKDFTPFTGKLPDLEVLAHLPYDSTHWQSDTTLSRYPAGDSLLAQLGQEQPLPLQFAAMVGKVNGQQASRAPARQYAFSRADTLRGALSAGRSCYDVTYYHLDVGVMPETKSIAGASTIRFRVVVPFKRMQIDLHRDMQIDSITLGARRLSFEREFDAVFVQLADTLPAGRLEQITVHYRGRPREMDLDYRWSGGFLWKQDEEGNPWVTVVCQGLGASLWWPCKDHLSDEPDSALVSVTVPEGLMNVSNGRLRGVRTLADGRSRYDWFVSYPINTYNLTLNVGKYAHFRAYHASPGTVSPSDTLTLDYYVLPGHLPQAKAYFAQVPRMLTTYEGLFGPYPFRRDGFKAVESVYIGMEHQSAIAIGDGFALGMETAEGPLDCSPLLLHEAAHEWWGNHLSMGDIADMWIHEAFTTYAEALFLEKQLGVKAAFAYLNGMEVVGKEPIVGRYGVNHVFYRDDDMYTKGALMLHTLRHVLDDDARWFALLKDLQAHFHHRIVNTEDVVSFFNQRTGRDLTPFFNQYLHYPNIPTLELQFKPQGNGQVVFYRWKADVKNFNMPVKVQLRPGQFTFIHPTTRWQKLKTGLASPSAFQVAEDQFYVNVTRTAK